MSRGGRRQCYAREIRALRRARVPLAVLEAVADLVQARQFQVICRNLADLGRAPRNGKPPALRDLTPEERESWLQGVRLYLGAAVAQGWRPPAPRRAGRAGRS